MRITEADPRPEDMGIRYDRCYNSRLEDKGAPKRKISTAYMYQSVWPNWLHATLYASIF